jgi:V/A-type H+/Na+-transporting ATPase subunit C
MQNLTFLIGRIRSKERTLLTKTDWQRFLECSDLSSWLNVLKDSPYSEIAANARTYEEFETALNNHLLNLKNDLFSTSSYAVENLLWQKYDFHNLKIFLKIHFGHKDLRKYTVPLGEIPVEKLEAYLLENENVALPPELIKIIKTAKAIYEKDNDFSKMDQYLDDIYFQKLLSGARTYGEHVLSFVKYQADYSNFKLWWFAKSNHLGTQTYLKGGNFPPRFFETAEDQKANEVLTKIFPAIKSDLEEDEALWQKEIEDFLSNILYQKRYPNEGVLPILIFFRAKEMEIKNLKTFYLRQSKNLKELSKFMRLTYV